MKIAIIIPAHNEERRIGKTLDTYHTFFSKKAVNNAVTYQFIIVLNGCTDTTNLVVQERIDRWGNSKITSKMIHLTSAGKGRAVKAGFYDALQSNYDLIGFVDADMATHPEQFWYLIEQLGDADGIIAGRYMPGAHIFPKRPAIKEWGRRLVYQPLVWTLFGLTYYDNQCGAKLFKRSVIAAILPAMTVTEWAFDVELLYLCRRAGFTIIERPTIWYDQADSKLKIFKEHRMLTDLVKARWRHSRFYAWFYTKEKW